MPDGIDGNDAYDIFTDVPLNYGNGRDSTPYLSQLGRRRTSYESEKIDHDDDEFSPLSRLPSVDTPPTSSDSLPLDIPIYHEVLFIIVVVMAQFMAFAGLGQAIAPMQYIAQDLDVTDPSQQAYFAAAYSMTLGTFILISGRMGDILGHKRILVFGYFFLGSWSAFTGFSAYIHSQIFFDVCRAFQGIGAALLTPNALALLGRAYRPGSRKNLVFALYGIMAPWGFVLGALYASVFAQVAWWPWTFWSYAIVAWLLSACSIIVIPKALSHDAQFSGTPNKSDWDMLGSLLGVLGLVLVNVAWNNGPIFGWGRAHVYFILILGIAFLVAFCWVESRAVSPILPLSTRSMGGTAVLALGWGSFSIWIYYSFRFLEDMRSSSPVSASAQFVPLMIVGVLAAGATSFILNHTPVHFMLFASMMAFFVGEIITATQPMKQTYWAQMFIAVVIMPFGKTPRLLCFTTGANLSPGMAMSVPAATLVSYNSMPPANQGVAASLVYAVIHYSMSIALGIASTVEVQVNNHNATKGDTLWGIRCAFWTGVAMAGIGVVLSCVFFGRSLLRDGWRATTVV